MKNKTQSYSKGVFLNIVSDDKDDWKNQLSFIESLRNVKHVEVFLEKDLTPVEIAYLKILIRKYRIIIHGPFANLSLFSPHKEINELTIKIYLRILKIAQLLGAKLVTFHCGSKLVFYSDKATEKNPLRNLKKLKNLYKGKIPFSIENMPSGTKGVQKDFFVLIEDFIRTKKIFHWLKFTLDIGHAIQNGENEKIFKFIKDYKNSILNIHLHDGKSGGEAHLAIGKGEFDVKEFFHLLNKIDYNGYVSLETVTKEDTYKSWRKIIKI